MLLTFHRLRELLSYDPLLGHFAWRVRRHGNGGLIEPGDRAGYVGGSAQRRRRFIGIDGVIYHEHRLAWLYMTGAWPEHEVDHIDRDPCNTRWSNLRAATHKQNAENSIQPLGASRVRGVRWQLGGWSARITHYGREIHLGRFNRLDDAAEFRELAREMLFTHHQPEIEGLDR
jgi:hypothetical protein